MTYRNLHLQVVLVQATLWLLGLVNTRPAWSELPAIAASCAEVESPLSQARQALDKGNDAVADQVLSQIQASHPQCHEAILLLGRLRAAQGDGFSAQKLFSLYTELEPKDVRGYSYLGDLLLSQGSYQRAESMSLRAISLNPDDPEALNLRGRILLMKGQVIDAEEALSRACKLAPDNVQAHFELGKLYDTNHKNLEATNQFERVIALNPKDPRAYDYLALNLDALIKFERAEWAYKKGLEVNQGPLKDAFLDYNYGRFLMSQNRLTEAKIHVDLAVEQAPKNRAVHFERAKLHVRLRKYKEARQDAERALNLMDPGRFVLDLQVYSQLATIYSRLGEKELAAKYVKLSQNTSIPLDGYKMIR